MGTDSEPTDATNDDAPRWSYNDLRRVLSARYASATEAQKGANAEAARGGVVAITNIAGDLGVIL